MQKDLTTEQKIVEAAKQVFLEKGMAGARMQDIADRAGINKALLHYYFRSKEKLFEIIFEEAAGKFIPQLNEVFDQTDDLFLMIRHFVATYINTIGENPYIPAFVAHEINQNPDRILEKFIKVKVDPFPLAQFFNAYQKALKEGKIRPIAPDMLMVNLISMSIFPFIGRPMIKIILQKDEAAFTQFIERRKIEVAEFAINAIKI